MNNRLVCDATDARTAIHKLNISWGDVIKSLAKKNAK